MLIFRQGAEGSGDRDGDVHRHVLPLPADQDHEERPDTDKRVSTSPDIMILFFLKNLHVEL